MTVMMAPGASTSHGTKGYPSLLPVCSDEPTTSRKSSPSHMHREISSVHGKSPRPIPWKGYNLVPISKSGPGDPEFEDPTVVFKIEGPRHKIVTPGDPSMTGGCFMSKVGAAVSLLVSVILDSVGRGDIFNF